MQDVKMTDQFAGHEILQDMKLQDTKLQDMKMTDQKWRQGVKWRENKYRFNRDNTTMNCANF